MRIGQTQRLSLLDRMKCIGAILTILLIQGCTREQPAKQSLIRPGNLSATSTIDEAHRIALSVHFFTGTAAGGLTPLKIDVRDDRGAAVRDAIVYAQIDSVTGSTPKMTLLATANEGVYRIDLPLVYGSKWTSTIEAFSGGRNAILTVVEDLK